MEAVLQARVRELLSSDPVPEVRAQKARALSVAARRTRSFPSSGPHAGDALVRALGERPELWQEASAGLPRGATGRTERLRGGAGRVVVVGAPGSGGADELEAGNRAILR